MREYLQKIWTISLLSLSFAGVLQAQENGYGEYEGCCDHTCCCDSNWLSSDRLSIRAEGLYWKATEDNLSFARKESAFAAITEIGPDGLPVAEFAKGINRKEELNFKWKPGVRLTLDYILPCNSWDTCFVWTHLNSHASGSKNAPDVTILPPTTTTPTTGMTLASTFLPPTALGSNADTTFNHIDARWHLEFNNFEWDIGRNICISTCFDLRPYIGLKWERFKQRYNIHYVLNQDPHFPNDNFGTAEQIFRSNFSGFGLQGGFDANWFMGCGFSLFSNVSGGIAYGRAKVHETIIEDVSFPAEGASETFVLKYRDTAHVARPNVDLALGLRWEYLLCDCYVVSLQAAWEYHHYFDQNFFRMAQDDDSARGSLSMQGVTFGGGISF